MYFLSISYFPITNKSFVIEICTLLTIHHHIAIVLNMIPISKPQMPDTALAYAMPRELVTSRDSKACQIGEN